VSAAQKNGQGAGDESSSGFSVRVSKDRMSVLLDCVVSEETLLPLAARVAEQLAGMKLAAAPGEEELAGLIRSATEKNPVIDGLVLVEGTKPVPPQDGKLEWTRDFFSPGFAVDERTGAIDYRRRAANLSVSKGELLLRTIPHREGKPGTDVFGKAVRPRKAKRARLKAGPNVRFEEDPNGGGSYYALSDGRIRLNAGVVAVDIVYAIPGSVGLATGHVKHPGSLVIDGDVEAGSQIEAGGDIEIKGHVEASDIQAGGNLTVRGGITGADGRHIKAGGSVHAKFILDVDIEDQGDVVAETDVTQCTLKTRGAVTVPGGRLVGGEATALAGITVGQAGSPGMVPTILRAGFDYALDAEVSSRTKKVAELEKAIEKVNNRIQPLMLRRKRLSASQREVATAVLAKISEMEMARKDLNDEIENLVEESRARAMECIVVKEKAFPETIFHIRKARLRLRNEAAGPLRAVIEKRDLVLRPVR